MCKPIFERPVRKVLFAILLLCAATPAAMAQSNDTESMEKLLTTVRITECQDYLVNAQNLIPRYHNEGKFDSIAAVIDFVTSRCSGEIFDSYRLLRQIQVGELAPDWCDSDVVDEMLSIHDYLGFCDFWAYSLVGASVSDYDSFIRQLAFELKRTADTTSVAHAITTYYSSGRDSLLTRLTVRSYPGTCLQDRYDAIIEDLVKKRQDFATNLSVNTGAWIPNGNLDILGPKIELGAQAGLRNRRFGADLTFLVRFLNAKESYFVRHEGSLYETDNFLGLYLGVDPVLRVYSAKKTGLEVFGGIGWDGIMALTADDIDENAADYLNSFNVNMGFTWRWFYGVRRTRYFGIQTRYNVVDYSTEGGTDLSGNSISINLLWGWMAHGWVDGDLDEMHYFQRH